MFLFCPGRIGDKSECHIALRAVKWATNFIPFPVPFISDALSCHIFVSANLCRSVIDLKLQNGVPIGYHVGVIVWLAAGMHNGCTCHWLELGCPGNDRLVDMTVHSPF